LGKNIINVEAIDVMEEEKGEHVEIEIV